MTSRSGRARQIRDTARRAFGHDRLLPGQSEATAAVLDGRDVLLVSPTGSGKSLVYQVPESPDTYYQEVGRAGRDGRPATGTLVYRPEDLALGRFFSAGVPRREDVARVVEAAGDVGPEPPVVAERSGLGRRRVGRILNLVGLVEAAGGGSDTVDGVLELAEAHRSLERSRVEMVRTYAETDRCPMGFLVGYFGEQLETRCGSCDNCVADVAPAPTGDEGSPYPLQSHVEHEELGPGVVTDVEDDRLTVLFDRVGYRTLSLELVEEQHLLSRR